MSKQASPAGPLPPSEDRAYAADIRDRYQIPLANIYRLMDSGRIPWWPVGCRKRCSSWAAVRAFFEGVKAPSPTDPPRPSYGNGHPDPPRLEA